MISKVALSKFFELFFRANIHRLSSAMLNVFVKLCVQPRPEEIPRQIIASSTLSIHRACPPPPSNMVKCTCAPGIIDAATRFVIRQPNSAMTEFCGSTKCIVAFYKSIVKSIAWLSKHPADIPEVGPSVKAGSVRVGSPGQRLVRSQYGRHLQPRHRSLDEPRPYQTDST